jgi:hypothetical protein
MAIRADHVGDFLSVGPHPPLVLIRETAETEGDRGRLARFGFDGVILRIQRVGVARSSRPAI